MGKIPELHPVIWQYGKRDIIKKFRVCRTTLNNVLRGLCENAKAIEGLIWFLKEHQQSFIKKDEVYAEIEVYMAELNGRLKQARKNEKRKLALMERRRKKAMKLKK